MRSCTGRRSSSVIDREVIPPPHAAYITFFRAIGAVLITNSHFTGVYPSDIVANGGLLGDVEVVAKYGRRHPTRRRLRPPDTSIAERRGVTNAVS